MTRHVTTGPPRPSGRLRVVDQLNAEWSQLAASSPRAAELVELLDRASRGCDAALHTLLAAAQQGDALAARTVLQSMLGRLVQMAGRDRRSSPVDYYVSAAWCVIGGYPLAARPTRIAANLALDTLKTVHQESRWWRRHEGAWLAGDELESAAGERSAALVRDRPELDDATRVIQAGLRLRLIDESAGEVLRHVYVKGLSGAETATRLSSTPGAVRTCCSRSVRRLADRADDLAEVA